MKTAVVILNWNTERYLKAFLPQLVSSCPADAEVIVADNGSSDGSLDWVHEKYPQLTTIPLDTNYGFTGGYNRALSQGQAEHFVLINSDVISHINRLNASKNGCAGISFFFCAVPILMIAVELDDRLIRMHFCFLYRKNIRVERVE